METTTSPQETVFHFNDQDLKDFDADDVDAGKTLGRLLSFFFMYTIIAVGMVCWFTWEAVHETQPESQATSHAHTK